MTREEQIELYKSSIGIAMDIVKKYKIPSQREDLEQEALAGLWRAVITYDAEKAKFTTWATKVIRTRISAYIYYKTLPVKVPAKVDWQKYHNILQSRRTLSDQGVIYEQEKGVPLEHLSILLPRSRYIVEQKVFHNRKFHDIAAELGISKQRVFGLYTIAIRKLKERLEGKYV